VALSSGGALKAWQDRPVPVSNDLLDISFCRSKPFLIAQRPFHLPGVWALRPHPIRYVQGDTGGSG